MPNEGDPGYAVWKAALETEFDGLSDRAIPIGHSVGGTILINLLAEQTVNLKPAAILLIAAPFIGQGGWTSEDITPQPDLEGRLPRDVPVFLYQGSEDEIGRDSAEAVRNVREIREVTTTIYTYFNGQLTGVFHKR
jgi:predicted alpha/beta hydrolase family esterase